MSYLLLNNTRRKNAIERCIRVLKAENFEHIVCTGTSGLLVAPEVASRLKKKLVIVRPGRKKDHHQLIEYDDDYTKITGSSYIVIDDFVETGQTLNSLIRQFGKRACVGIYLYAARKKDLENREYYFEAYAKNTNLKVVKIP